MESLILTNTEHEPNWLNTCALAVCINLQAPCGNPYVCERRQSPAGHCNLLRAPAGIASRRTLISVLKPKNGNPKRHRKRYVAWHGMHIPGLVAVPSNLGSLNYAAVGSGSTLNSI